MAVVELFPVFVVVELVGFGVVELDAALVVDTEAVELTFFVVVPLLNTEELLTVVDCGFVVDFAPPDGVVPLEDAFVVEFAVAAVDTAAVEFFVTVEPVVDELLEVVAKIVVVDAIFEVVEESIDVPVEFVFGPVVVKVAAVDFFVVDFLVVEVVDFFVGDPVVVVLNVEDLVVVLVEASLV